jgi:hypothetical protein
MRVTDQGIFVFSMEELHLNFEKFCQCFSLPVISVQLVAVVIVLTLCFLGNQMKITFTYEVTARWYTKQHRNAYSVLVFIARIKKLPPNHIPKEKTVTAGCDVHLKIQVDFWEPAVRFVMM